MKKDSKKTVALVKKKSGIIEALIQSIIPTLILVCLSLGFWNLFWRNFGIDGQAGSVSNMPVMFADIVANNPPILFVILSLLGFNFLAYYVIFRIAGKCVAYPWCCVAVCSQLMVVFFCVIGGIFAGGFIHLVL